MIETIHPLHPINDLLAEYEDAIAHLERQPLPWRTARLRQWGHPRSLYKFRALPLPNQLERKQRLDELKYILLDSTLWLAATTSFNDPFDGRAAFRIAERGDALRDALVSQIVRVAQKDARQALALIHSTGVLDHPELLEHELSLGHERLRDSVGICSLSATPSSQLMWAHYGYEHRGICFRFEVARDLRNLIAHKVIYADDYPVVENIFTDAPSELDLRPLLQKSPDWAYEKEWRVIKVNGARTTLPFDPAALTAVIFGMRTSVQDRDHVLDLLSSRERKYGYPVRVFEAMPAFNQYRLRFRPIEHRRPEDYP
ncbi:MAG: DUF2971 domain-containing protein [Luteibacter sp.]